MRYVARFVRLRYVRGTALTLGDVGPYITGGLIASIEAWQAVITHFVGRYKFSTGIVVTVIVVMLAYRLVVLGPLPIGK